jgi:hypothetical protein
MICQRCYKACADRTQGRPVRLAGKELFFCNSCSLLAAAGSEDGDRESSGSGLGTAFQTGEQAGSQGQ